MAMVCRSRSQIPHLQNTQQEGTKRYDHEPRSVRSSIFIRYPSSTLQSRTVKPSSSHPAPDFPAPPTAPAAAPSPRRPLPNQLRYHATSSSSSGGGGRRGVAAAADPLSFTGSPTPAFSCAPGVFLLSLQICHLAGPETPGEPHRGRSERAAILHGRLVLVPFPRRGVRFLAKRTSDAAPEKAQST